MILATPQSETKRIIGLDVVRGAAILIVLYAHGALVLPDAMQKAYYHFLPALDGVSLFFILSGFLIGGILLKIIETSAFTTTDLLNFWIRRWFRTLPNYFLVLLLILIYRIVVYHNIKGFSWSFVFFVQNLAWPHPDFFREAWSLAVEEWFYLLLPVSYFLLHKTLKNKRRAFMLAVAVFLIVPLAIRIIKFQLQLGPQDWDEAYRKVVVMRLDSLMYGVAGACIYRYKKTFWMACKYPALIIGLLLVVLMGTNWGNWTAVYPPVYFNIESFTALCFIPFFSELKTTGSRFFDWFFTWMSKLAYALYLLNLTVMLRYVIPTVHIFMGWRTLPVEQTYQLDYAIYIAGNFMGAYLIYTLFEQHITKLRDKVRVGKKARMGK